MSLPAPEQPSVQPESVQQVNPDVPTPGPIAKLLGEAAQAVNTFTQKNHPPIDIDHRGMSLSFSASLPVSKGHETTKANISFANNPLDGDFMGVSFSAQGYRAPLIRQAFSRYVEPLVPTGFELNWNINLRTGKPTYQTLTFSRDGVRKVTLENSLDSDAHLKELQETGTITPEDVRVLQEMIGQIPALLDAAKPVGTEKPDSK